MKFSKIEIKNFRQYYGSVSVDLETEVNKNIIIVGGRNGYGKTNFLLSIVWCLFGDRISQIDDNFKKEIQKEKNYPSFMQQSINWTAKKKNETNFSVSIKIIDISLPELPSVSQKIDSVVISRTFDVATMGETLSIIGNAGAQELFNSENDKISFINDFIIPIDAAKFVFFDAEKIAEIANLSIKDEGSFINDALGRILGLDVYESLVDDLEYFVNELKKEGATKHMKEQIINAEKGIELSDGQADLLEEENAERLKEIDDLKKNIREFENLISQRTRIGGTIVDRGTILSEIDSLNRRETEITERFNELIEIIPLAILTGKLEEVTERLGIQEANDLSRNSSRELNELIESFIDKLFNRPPNPEGTTMSLGDKEFYCEKARSIGLQLIGDNGQYRDLDFEHDLNNFEKKLIGDSMDLIGLHSKDLIESTIDDFNRIRTRISNLRQTLNRADADLDDELILEYSSRKETAEFNIGEKNRQIGVNDQKIAKLKADIIRLNQELSSLVKKVEISEMNNRKIKKTNQYVEVLKEFLNEQRENHKDNLEKAILSELRMLMHKLKTEDDHSKFIENVKVTILAAGQGMKITLFDQDDNEIRKEGLSSGEKQIYISCLIKAILNESVIDLPIFIDTPLGRLDEEHRDTITKEYYPKLSKQVVLFSTNSEITPKRYKEIAQFISKSYLLVNDGVNTGFKSGYFNTPSND